MGPADVQAGYGVVVGLHDAHDGGAGAALQRLRDLKALQNKQE